VAVETIPTLREAEVLVDLMASFGARGWLSYQCRDATTTAAGEPVDAAFAVAADAPWVMAVGVNCVAPRYVPALLVVAAEATGLPTVAYPSGGDAWDQLDRRWLPNDGDAFDPEVVATWADLGAVWLGGCCGTGPSDIAALARALKASPTKPPETCRTGSRPVTGPGSGGG
jgi:homocysteine S-methyltransferase